MAREEQGGEQRPCGVEDAYTWSLGTCYRCGAADVPTAVVGVVAPPGEPRTEIRACLQCTRTLEYARALAALRHGWPYAPGTPLLESPEEERLRGECP